MEIWDNFICAYCGQGIPNNLEYIRDYHDGNCKKEIKMSENKIKEEKWREEFEKLIPSIAHNLKKRTNDGFYITEHVEQGWQGYLAGRKAGEEEINVTREQSKIRAENIFELQKEISQLKVEIEQLKTTNEKHDETIFKQWENLNLQGREIEQLKSENEKLKKKIGFTYGFQKRECNNCGHDSSRGD